MTPSPDDQLAGMIANLPEKTGRSLEAWISHLQKAGLDAHKEIMAHLKGEHGVTHGYANLVSQLARKAADGDADDDPVAAQYAGGKADLRAIHDRLVEAVQGFGSDVELAPKKAYVSLRRSKQFGLIQPSTKTRVDVGIKLRDREPAGRLESSGSWNSMVTHRVRVTSQDEVDAELVGWLREAYDEG
jgi:hypothetical protein